MKLVLFKTPKSKWLASGAALFLIGLAAVKITLALGTFVPADQPTGYVSQDEMTSYDLRSGNEILFRGQYEKEYWSGNLIAYAINSEGDLSTATQPWNAQEQLDNLTPASRLIATRRDDGTSIPFAWSSLSAAQRTSIDSANASNGTSNIMDFLRGERSQEIQQGNGGTLRHRYAALGDIMHSRPYYVADGGTNPTVFVGANDGMLHAFNAKTGVERWAYVPSMLIPKLKNLASTSYTHDYFVDGSMAISELTDSTRVLVGTLGAGGKGLYALDITGTKIAPATETSAASNILWEITSSSLNSVASTSYANLGYTYANPSIVNVSVSGTATSAVIIGNGYGNTGDYQAYLYVINAKTGVLISAIKAGTSGTSSSPNGLSTPIAIDADGDGLVETAYAGDVNGTMWKFSLGNLTSPTATTLLTTSPAQPITMTPGVAAHPNGGIMVNFATGAMLTSSDASDTSVFYAYGIWDGAPAANSALLAQTITERCYTSGTAAAASPCASRVRTVTSNAATWTSGAGNHKGWRVPLPAGNRVVGDGSFIENGRFYFTTTNPTVSNTVQASTVMGENWLMELDYLTGGTKNNPFLDLSGNQILNDDDRVKLLSATPITPDTTTDGIPVGKFIGIGVMSQPVLVQLTSLNNTLFNQNPDVTIVPVVLGTGAGVTGGHFDVDIFYASPTAGTSATATITVGNTGQTSGRPATLGAITVGGVTLVSSLGVADITDGTNTTANATTIKNSINANTATTGFSATSSGAVVTITAPVGSTYNGNTISIGAGSSQAIVAGTSPTAGQVVMTAVGRNKTISIMCGGTFVAGTDGTFTSSNSSTASTRLDSLYTSFNGVTVNGYTATCSKSGSPTSSVTCNISAPAGVSACSSGFTVDSDISTTTNTGPSGGTAATGWTNLQTALTASTFNSSGADAQAQGDSCTGGWGSSCVYDRHIHQYDDKYDVTGVNTLNPSDAQIHLKLAIPSLNQNFKILVMNQYLNPAVKLNIGDPSYQYDVDYGYVSVKNYGVSSTLSLASLQTYRRDPNVVWPGAASTAAAKLAAPKPIGSLVWNMPLDALTAKDWWGNGDVRVGLIPMKPQCMWQSAGANDGNMYQPVVPPTNGTDGPGTKGWSASTTPATATGARHGGALIIQLIKDTTPDSAIEQNVPGRPEYGWRVTSSQFKDYVLVEYGTYWHHPNGKCFYDTGWTKQPGADDGSSSLAAKAAGSTDPHIGDLSAGSTGTGTITSTTVSVVGNVTTTTITYANGTTATIVRTANTDGTVTTVTTDATGVVTTQTTANSDGSLKSGGDERGLQAKTGRVSWHEIVKK